MYDASGDQFARVEPIFETDDLSGSEVTIVGLGSFGSVCGDQLARCGVERFHLFDFDRVEPANVARHTCSLHDVGRLKTRVVADRIKAVNPMATIICNERDVIADQGSVEQAIAGSDVVVVCTDNNASRFMINELCLVHEVPAVYAGAYERAFGGHVIRVLPGETPCYECVIGGVLEKMGGAPEPESETVPYLGADQEAKFTAEPGLGIDTHMIALIQTKMALLTLLRGSETTLEDYPANMVFWGNRAGWIFPSPLHAQFANTTFRRTARHVGQ